MLGETSKQQLNGKIVKVNMFKLLSTSSKHLVKWPYGLGKAKSNAKTVKVIDITDCFKFLNDIGALFVNTFSFSEF